MSDTTIPTNESEKEESWGFSDGRRLSAILAAYVPKMSVVVDRCIVEGELTIGRGDACDFAIMDPKLSNLHAKIWLEDDVAWIEDQGSTNGTFVQGEPLEGRRALTDGNVVRAGGSILVYHSDAEPLMQAFGVDSHGFIGPFHTAALLRELKEAAASRRHLLLTGPSGSGKELAAKAVAGMLEKEMRVHNAARFTSEEEAMSTLFGVGQRVFSNVDSRPGLIEQARNKVLFLDEIHNLPQRVQRGLLRIVEDAEHERIGDSKPRNIDLKFVFASNAPGPFHGMAKDLCARLIKVSIPGLNERVGDIPALFKHLLFQAGARYGVDVDVLLEKLSTDHFEALCLGDYADSNVRGLVDIADRLVVKFDACRNEGMAIRAIFREHFGSSVVALRTGHGFRTSRMPLEPTASRLLESTVKEDASVNTSIDKNDKLKLVQKLYLKTGGNVTAIKKILEEEGVSASRRWISSALDDLGLSRIRRG